MKKQKAAWMLVLALWAFVPTVFVRDGSQPQSVGPADTSPGPASQNIKAYTDLLRSDVRQQKAGMIGEVMQLGAADAATFQPIYNEYDADLNKRPN